MDIACDKCQAKFKIPDNKIPKGQTISVPCPKCKNKISIEIPPDDISSPDKEAASRQAKPPPQTTAASSDTTSEPQEPSDSPFGYLEEGTQTAMICESDATIRAKIKTALETLNYRTSEPNNPRDALKQMRFHEFNAVAINERFGTRDPDMNHVMKYLAQLPMHTRRNIFVAMISDRFPTMDSMMTYNKSVNLIINVKNLNEIDKVLKRGITENKNFYRIYKETLAKFGKA